MKSISSTVSTTAYLSADGLHRYSLEKVWDEKKPKLLVLMLVAGTSDSLCVDASTCHVMENAVRLGFGSVIICNLFSCIGDFHLRNEDSEYYAENEKVILAAAQEANTVVYCPGRGKAALKVFQARERELLSALKEVSMLSISDGVSSTQYHPLSPKVKEWTLVPFNKEGSKEGEAEAAPPVTPSKKKGRKKAS